MPDITIIPNVAAFQEHVGKLLGSSSWHQVTQSQIDAFAEATGDQQWIHTDVERAERESPFKQTIAHGYLTLALIPVLFDEIVRVDNVGRTINMGISEVRFRAPVLSDSRIRLLISVKDARVLRGGPTRVSYSITIEIENESKPACTGEINYVYYP